MSDQPADQSARLPEKYRGCSPGEWRVDATTEAFHIESDAGSICKVQTAPESAALGICSQTRLKNHQRNRRSKANARLIADAPALAIRVQELEAALREGIRWTNRAIDLEVSGSMQDAAKEFTARAESILAKGVK